MAKFEKAALIARLEAKRTEEVERARKLTEGNKVKFEAWKAAEVGRAEAEVKRVKAIKFDEPYNGYQGNRPAPAQALTKGLDQAITELQCMAGDVVQLTPSSSILGML